MKNSLFHPDNWIWKPFGSVADFLLLSCLWLLCSIPVVTAGAASAAMYDCCARCIQGGEQAMLSRFFRTFRRELKQGALGTLLWGGICLALALVIRGFTGSADASGTNLTLAYAMALLLAFVVGMGAWVFPLQSRFTFRFADLQLTAVRLAIGRLPRTLALAAVNIAAGWLCLHLVVPVMVVPAIAALLSAHILEPVFQSYETGDAGDNT